MAKMLEFVALCLIWLTCIVVLSLISLPVWAFVGLALFLVVLFCLRHHYALVVPFWVFWMACILKALHG